MFGPLFRPSKPLLSMCTMMRRAQTNRVGSGSVALAAIFSSTAAICSCVSAMAVSRFSSASSNCRTRLGRRSDARKPPIQWGGYEGVADADVVAGGCRRNDSLRGLSRGGSSAAGAVGCVLNGPVDGRDGDGLVGEDGVPGAERLVGGDGEAPGLLVPCNQFEENGALGLVLLRVGDVVENDHVELVEPC